MLNNSTKRGLNFQRLKPQHSLFVCLKHFRCLFVCIDLLVSFHIMIVIRCLW